MVGGRGVDSISTGQGRDRVLGGPGNDIINATIVGPANRVDCGPGRRDRVRVNRNELKRIKNCEFVYLLDRRTPPLR
jgi:Ca2+-binding RTX toxin-like protein